MESSNEYNKLDDALLNKMQDEYNQFLADLIDTYKDNPRGIIQHAYGITYMQDILCCFKTDAVSCTMTTDEIQHLLDMKNPLGFLYSEWLGCDLDHTEMLVDSIKDSVAKVLRHDDYDLDK